MDVVKNRRALMVISFLTLVACGMGVATRTAVAPALSDAYGISAQEYGTILGLGFVGFGVVILIGGFIVEFLGYRNVLLLAVVLHLLSAVMVLATPTLYDYWSTSNSVAEESGEGDGESAVSGAAKSSNANAKENTIYLLMLSVLLFSVCSGLYEAVINPLIGQVYPEDQTHYLNILHAGWPGGLIVGGLFAVGFMTKDAVISEIPWHLALGSYSIVLLLLLVLSLKATYPATVSQGGKTDFGVLFSCFISLPFLILIVMHGLIGYMELGVDSWQTRLMENLVTNSVIVLVYTSLLMFVLRFFAGPIVHKLNPVGLLLLSSVLAVLGLVALGYSTTVGVIFAAATLYSLGKAFLWPTMLAIAGERYPQCGAVSMSALGAAGMISVGLIGGPAIGVKQAISANAALEQLDQEVHARYQSNEEGAFFGYKYNQIDTAKQQPALEFDAAEEGALEAAKTKIQAGVTAENIAEDDAGALIANLEHDAPIVVEAYNSGGRRALRLTAFVPVGMTIGFLVLFMYYKSIGGYKVLDITGKPVEESGQDKAASEA
jgi:MFS family permease